MDKVLMLNKIKAYLNFRKDTEFASYLGIKPNVLANWFSRNTFNVEILAERCDFLSFEWLLTGKGEMLKENRDKEESLDNYELPTSRELELMKKINELHERLYASLEREKELTFRLNEKNDKSN